MNARAPFHGEDDRGVSLIELIIYVLVGGIITGVITMLTITGLTAEADARSREIATGDALVAQTSLQTNLRNARAGSTLAGADGRSLDACVLQADGTWQTMRWEIVPNPQDTAKLALTVRTGGGAGAVIVDDVTPIAAATPFFVVKPAVDIEDNWSNRDARVIDYRFNARDSGVSVPVDGRVLAQAWSAAGGCS